MQRIISALTKVPPTPRWRRGQPTRAISDTRSCRPPPLDMNQRCGMIAYQAIISGANPIPPGAIRMVDRRGGAAADVDFQPRRVPARSRVPANKRLGRQLACGPQAMWGGVAPRRSAAVRFKKPATGLPARAQFLRCWRYAGDLPDVSNLLRDPRQRVPSQVPELAARPLCWQPFREFWRLAARPLCWQLFRELWQLAADLPSRPLVPGGRGRIELRAETGVAMRNARFPRNARSRARPYIR
jgi:hypothetical protein